jgi:hyperosmotically inducible protein
MKTLPIASLVLACMLSAAILSCPFAAAQDAPSHTDVQARGLGQAGTQRVAKEVHHELILLPYYGVFDNLAYKIDANATVTLLGQVTRPVLKSDAEGAVKHIEGVEQVVNQIEVLPVSPNDERLRRAIYRAIYGVDALSQYALQAVPPIHIIVKNANVTLEGAVGSQLDKSVAETKTNGVSGVLSLTDNLMVDNGN